ncbi:MAG: gliding motility-associated C-terminal domain-containing protein [Flavobacteriales bacterium]|nr:gliding motility-associated C-terminal domain-containing protein [Flavobacteriales bacterium]
MPKLRLLLSCLPVAIALTCQAQPVNDDCAEAVDLCAGQPAAGDNTGAINSMPAYCQPGAQAVWYTFTTNAVGGPVSVALENINCPDLAGMGNALSAVIFSGDGSCDPNSFQVASPCQSDSVPFSVTSTQALAANTQYWVMVGGMRNNGATIAAQCGFNISVSGPGMDVVNVVFDAGPNVVIAAGASTQLHATGGTSYVWSPTSGLSGNTVPDPVAQPNETTMYTVSTVINGCTYVDTVIVEVKHLVAPVNTFTPNGDGINDTWDVPELANYPQAEVSIHDRWGQRVFHSIGYKQPFDGEGLPAATYYWYIQVNDVGGKSDPYTGYVTIVR